MLLAAVVLAVAGLGITYGILHGGSAFPDRYAAGATASSPGGVAPHADPGSITPPLGSCETSSGTGDGAQWSQTWSLRTGLEVWADNYSWDTYSCGDYIIVASATPNYKTDLRGYRLTADGPEEIWYRPATKVRRSEGNSWWGGRLVLGNDLIDPRTGAVSEAPWLGSFHVHVVTPELVVACKSGVLTERASCEAWDWSGTNEPTMRWTRSYDFTHVQPRQNGIAGSPASGSIVARLTTSSENPEEALSIMSLEDGSLQGQWSDQGEQRNHQSFIPASDGWIRILRTTGDAEALSVSGESLGTIPLTGSNAMLLVAPEGQPTVDQYRAAFTSGDTSWARAVLECPEDTSDCLFNGSPITLPGWVGTGYSHNHGYFQNRWTLTPDGATLVIRSRDTQTIIGSALLIKVARAEVIDLGSSVTGRKAYLPVLRGDLIIAIDGATLIAFEPGG